MPSSIVNDSSTMSCSIGFAPSENSRIVAAGLAAASCTPAAKTNAPPQMCGATVRPWAEPSATIFCASLMPPQMPRSGCRMSTARALDQVAEVEARELALARGDRDVGRRAHLGGAAAVVGVDGLLEPG